MMHTCVTFQLLQIYMAIALHYCREAVDNMRKAHRSPLLCWCVLTDQRSEPDHWQQFVMDSIAATGDTAALSTLAGTLTRRAAYSHASVLSAMFVLPQQQQQQLFYTITAQCSSSQR
jgi:hypothetical protein